jgi:hypothetical protein
LRSWENKPRSPQGMVAWNKRLPICARRRPPDPCTPCLVGNVMAPAIRCPLLTGVAYEAWRKRRCWKRSAYQQRYRHRARGSVVSYLRCACRTKHARPLLSFVTLIGSCTPPLEENLTKCSGRSLKARWKATAILANKKSSPSVFTSFAIPGLYGGLGL